MKAMTENLNAAITRSRELTTERMDAYRDLILADDPDPDQLAELALALGRDLAKDAAVAGKWREHLDRLERVDGPEAQQAEQERRRELRELIDRLRPLVKQGEDAAREWSRAVAGDEATLAHQSRSRMIARSEMDRLREQHPDLFPGGTPQADRLAPGRPAVMPMD